MFLSNRKELEDFCILTHAIVKMPILFIQDNGLILFEISGDSLLNPLFDYRSNIYYDITNNNVSFYPQTISTKYLENLLVLYADIADDLKGYLVFGPSIAHLASGTLELMNELELSAKEKLALNKYFNSLPVINYHELIKIGIFIYYIFHKEVIEVESVDTASYALQNVQSKVENEYNIQYRDINYLNRSSFFERKFFNLIKNGEVEELKKLLKVHSLDGEYIVLAKNNSLRSWKNLVICFITICCRAAMEGGLPTETTYAISDVYIQKLEELTTIKDVEDIATNIFIDMTDRVRTLKSQQYSSLISNCQNFISKNLIENLTLSTISKHLKVNSSYLSNQFKSEIGMTLSEYIIGEKIREAKRMLLFTQFSILEIYTTLGFCDQSHFTKVFKKSTGLTPKNFRDTYSSSTLWE